MLFGMLSKHEASPVIVQAGASDVRMGPLQRRHKCDANARGLWGAGVL